MTKWPGAGRESVGMRKSGAAVTVGHLLQSACPRKGSAGRAPAWQEPVSPTPTPTQPHSWEEGEGPSLGWLQRDPEAESSQGHKVVKSWWYPI